MSEEVLINVTPQETRIAVVENGVLQEVYIERTRRRGLVGNIYKGRVSRVLPGMQAAFMDIGLQRTAFLHASDIVNQPAEWLTSDERRVGHIAELVKEGQELTVQVLKDPLGTKGARLTTQLTVPSRYLVLMPSARNIGISQKVEDEAERQRLKDIVTGLAGDMDEGGFIIRTAAEGADAESLSADMDYLKKLWSSVRQHSANATPGSVIYEDMPLVLRALRDLVDLDVEKVRIDSRENYKKALAFAQQFVPQVAPRIEYYPGERPIFDLYGVEDEIQKALERKVLLKSGGYLIIDQTEAMTTIDINTGAYVGHRTLEETIFKTNLEAAQAIARQLRLRNLGGIIIIDFIDMVEEEHKHQVLAALEKNLERDRAKSHISEVSALGLVEMTRKRTRESLEHVLCSQCPTCQGRGSIKTPETVCYEIFRELLREARQFDVQQYLVLASQEVVDMLLDEEATSLAELEAFIGKPIKLQVEALYSQEQFDVVLM
jgi:ribonuclease G